VDALPSLTPQQREELERYFRETPEGRAAIDEHFRTAEGEEELERYFRETPEGRAGIDEHFRTAEGSDLLQDAIAEDLRRRQPRFREALRADTAVYASLLMNPIQFHTGLRLLRETMKLAWTHDVFFCHLLYRLRVRLFVRGVPILPMILHRLCVMLYQVDIGNNVLIEPGVYMPHGKVVMDGMVHVGRGTAITPWVTLGLTTTIEGPSIGRDVMIGTGAKILGPVTVGDGARIAANAVVIHDVPPRTTVAGVPATVVRVHDRRDDPSVREVR
jgi:serine O-acetyltransferase